jgi:hypothetical protein
MDEWIEVNYHELSEERALRVGAGERRRVESHAFTTLSSKQFP